MELGFEISSGITNAEQVQVPTAPVLSAIANGDDITLNWTASALSLTDVLDISISSGTHNAN